MLVSYYWFALERGSAPEVNWESLPVADLTAFFAVSMMLSFLGSRAFVEGEVVGQGNWIGFEVRRQKR